MQVKDIETYLAIEPFITSFLWLEGHTTGKFIQVTILFDHCRPVQMVAQTERVVRVGVTLLVDQATDECKKVKTTLKKKQVTQRVFT